MKGFILKLNRVRDEDLIVTVLSKKNIGRYYRFYGARHSVLQMGYLIDFEVEQDKANFLPRIRNVTHHGFKWLYNREKLMYWHRFITIFEPHFRDVGEIDSFYFNMLLDAAKKWEKQSPKRVIVEKFIDILKYEGRTHTIEKCVICGLGIEKSISLIKGFLPAHPDCAHAITLNKKEIEYLFESGETLYLSDESVDVLCEIALKGLIG